MVKKFTKYNSNIFLIFFIGLIAVSFMFTGYEGMIGPSNVVAKVGNLPIKVNEYENEYQRQLSLYRNFNNNRDLTAQQIEQYRIKENVIDNLIQQRLWVKMAQNNGLAISDKEVVDKIKKQSWFLTDEKFDFEKYRSILRVNGMTASYFETLMNRDTLNALSKQIFSHYPVSKGYAKKLSHFKNQKISGHVLEIQKNSLKKHLKVAKNEIRIFLKEPKNLQKVKQRLKKSPSQKKGGIQKQEHALAKEMIQNSPSKEKALNAFTNRLVKKFQSLLKANKIKSVESLKKKYGFKMDKNISIDHFNGSKGTVRIAEKNLDTIFKNSLAKRQSYLFEDGGKLILVKTFPYRDTKKKSKQGPEKKPKTLAEKQKEEQKTAEYAFQRKLSRSIIDKLKKEISIKTYQNAL